LWRSCPSASGGAPAIAEPLAKLDQFKALTAQIVVLSRRNTNVLALDLSLGTKPALVAAATTEYERCRPPW